MTLKNSIRSVCLILALLCTGCSTRREEAQALASAGTTAANTLGSTLQKTREDIPRHEESLILVAALDGGRDPDPKELTNLQQISDALESRIQVLDDLTKAYASLNKLASYDAGAETKTALDSLMGSITKYAKAVNGADIPAPVQDAIGIATKGIMDFVQSQKIKEASIAIRRSLEAIDKIMANEQQYYATTMKLLTNSHADAARSLWNIGLGKPAPIIKQHLGAYGLDFDDAQLAKFLAADNKDPAAQKLRVAVDKIIVLHAKQETDLETAILDKNITAIKSLEAEHLNLENGKQLDFAAISSILATIQQFADDLAQLRSSKATVKKKTNP